MFEASTSPVISLENNITKDPKNIQTSNLMDCPSSLASESAFDEDSKIQKPVEPFCEPPLTSQNSPKPHSLLPYFLKISKCQELVRNF